MKPLARSLGVGVLLFASACNQSPQRLVEAGNRYHEKKKYQEASILYRKAIAKDKTYERAYYLEGLNLYEQKNPVEASKFFRKAVDLNPRNTDAEVKLSEIYLTAYASDQKKFRNLLPEVRDLTQKILQRDPHNVNGLRLQAFLYLADKDVPKALATFEEANRLKPDSPEIVGWLAQLLTASNRFPEAEKMMRDMIARDKKWGPAYDFLFVQYLQRKQVPQAEAVLKDRVANDPNSDAALINYSNYLVKTNRYDEGERVMRTVFDRPKDFPMGCQLMGDFYMRTNRWSQAADQYRQGIQADPANSRVYRLHLVGALVREGAQDPVKRSEALSLAKQVAQDNPKDPAALHLYASLLTDTISQGNVSGLATLQELTRKNNSDPLLHFQLARALHRSGNTDKALAETTESVRLRPSFLPARSLMARIYEDHGQHGKALEQTGIVLEKTPADAEVRLTRVRALIGLKDFRTAEPELKDLVARNPGYADAIYQLASLYLAQGRDDLAKQQYQRLWEGTTPNAPSDLRGFVGLQEVNLKNGKVDEAIRSMEDLAAKNPNRPQLRYVLANFQMHAASAMPSGNAQRVPLLAKAEENYSVLARTLHPSVDTLLKLGTAQRLQNKWDAALDSFEKAAKENPGNADAFLNKAMLLQAMGKTGEAREAYNQTLGVDPNNVVALNNLAFMTADVNQDLDQAMTFAERAKKRMPADANVSDTLGFVYLKKKLTQDALRELNAAVKGDPKNSSFRLHLAMALLQSGNRTEAKKEAENALKLSGGEQQKKVQAFLDRLS